jgi:uncharacterized protein (TIGR00297 family)
MHPDITLSQILIGFGLAILTGLAAWRTGALAVSGAVSASLVGGLIFSLGGLPWAALLLTFFISSSALSKLFRQKKAALAEKFAKGSQRDWGQVLANGGVGAFLVLLHALYPDQFWPWLAYAGAMATVNGDTWATELGVLSPKMPRLVTNGQPVERGTSGGVTLAGIGATLAGAALVALVMSLTDGRAALASVMIVIPLAGLAGATFDSLLGATVQAIYYDPERKKETERVIPGAEPVRGWAWMNNDAVNFISSIFGALLALCIWQLVQ